MVTDSQLTANVYMFNSPQFFFGLCGHSGIVFEYPEGRLQLYSFHPIKNEGELVDVGTIAHIVQPQDAENFDAFRRACMAEHTKRDGLHTRGIQISNGHKTWYERIRRVLRFRVTLRQWEIMKAFAQCIDDNTPRFNVVLYSCQHFVNDVLAAGDVVIRGNVLSYRHGIVPNMIYWAASENSQNILEFEKIDFRRTSSK